MTDKPLHWGISMAHLGYYKAPACVWDMFGGQQIPDIDLEGTEYAPRELDVTCPRCLAWLNSPSFSVSQEDLDQFLGVPKAIGFLIEKEPKG